MKLCHVLEQVQAERDELYQKFTKAINEVQQKTGFKNLLLERKLKATPAKSGISEESRWDVFGLWVWGFVSPTDGADEGNLAAGSCLVPGHCQHSLTFSN